MNEAIALVKLLEASSAQYKEGKHCSSTELKERIKEKFTGH